MTYAQAGIWLTERQMAGLGIFRGMVKDAVPQARPQNQPVGQACGNKLVESCGTFFGDKLYVACRTCPGPKR